MKAIRKGIYQEIVKRVMKVPILTTDFIGDGGPITRQLDTALISVGFKLSKNLLTYLSKRHPIAVKDMADNVLSAVKELVGDQVEHNVYFIEFPVNVPDTLEFWTQCIVDALLTPDSAGKIAFQLQTGIINLLDLPKYGKYQHSYEDMIEAHEQFIPSVKDRITILHLGKSLIDETVALYHSMAESNIPLNEDDREFLRELTKVCLTDPQPESIPVRENKAIVNHVRLENNQPLLVDTTTDILRLACALSDGDVTLQEKTKFKSFPRKIRRTLVKALNEIIEISPNKLADVNQYREQWKRLGERLHPYEYNLLHAHDVFAVARKDKQVRSLIAKAEVAFAYGDIDEVISLLSNAPGVLFRNVDRILRVATNQETATLLNIVQMTISKVSGRVILSLREHLQDRLSQGQRRIFANKKGTAWVETDKREPFKLGTVNRFFDIFDGAITSRIPTFGNLLIDKDILDVAVPLSDKSKASGFGIMPRGSITSVGDGILRFFIYWKEKDERTDYDLSALLLDDNFEYHGHLSYTNLRSGGCVHSGDLTKAPNGASEFIDVDPDGMNFKYIIPQVDIYSGESFEDIEESFFGFMLRTPEQKGKPFEPRTVRMKSDLQDKGKVALPLVFMKDKDGHWIAKWLHMYLKGMPNMNRVEVNRVNAALLAKTIIDRDYLSVRYLIELMEKKATSISWYKKGQEIPESATYIGIEAPEDFSGNVYTLSNLRDLIPA